MRQFVPILFVCLILFAPYFSTIFSLHFLKWLYGDGLVCKSAPLRFILASLETYMAFFFSKKKKNNTRNNALLLQHSDFLFVCSLFIFLVLMCSCKMIPSVYCLVKSLILELVAVLPVNE